MSSTDYHPALAPLSWLFGLWESVEAEVTYPSMSPLKYNEIIEFLPTAQPLVEYKSETWHPVKKVKMHCEKGFLRISPDSKKVAFMICHNFGLNELSEGSVENNSLCLESQSISRMSFSKNAKTVKVSCKKINFEGRKFVFYCAHGNNRPSLTNTSAVQIHKEKLDKNTSCK